MRTNIAAFLIPAALFAQTPRLAFEVASIRAMDPSAGVNGGPTAGVRIDGAQFRASMMPMRSLLGIAYKVRTFQLETPDWLASQWYTISATLPEGHSKSEEVAQMLQELLIERFHLKTHRETKDFPVYALTVAKGGILAKENPLDPADRTVEAVGTVTEGSTVIRLSRGSTLAIGGNKMEAKKFTMQALADYITQYLDRPVVNQTGLGAEAAYDITLEMTPEDFTAMRVRAALASGFTPPPQAMKALEASGDSLHAALAKMGLKLEPKKAPMEVLVIDASDKAPSEN